MRTLRRGTAPVFVAVLAATVGVVGGHFIWTGGGGQRSNATANTSNPYRTPLGGGFGGSGPGSGSGSGSGSGAGPSSGSGATSGNVASSVTSKVDPGLVIINTNLGYENEQAAGTGMVITASGEVFTNNHVIDGATTISATDVGNGHTYTARVVGYDYGRDVAVLQLVGASDLKTVHLGDSSSLTVGETIATIGNAGGTGSPTAASGKVSALKRSITAGDDVSGASEHLHGLVELNGDLQPGDSGGPLADSSGDVVGMDTAASSTFQFASAGGNGFAIPIDEVEAIAKQITNGNATGTIHIGATGFLGVNIQTSSNANGVTVEAVHSGTPAASTALAASDVITAIDGKAVRSAAGLSHLILQYHPGATIVLTWQTPSGATQSANVTLASGPPQ